MASSIKQIKKEVPVARLLRCRRTQRYFTGQGWSHDPAEAEIFADQMDAVRACVSNNLDNVELVLRANGTQAELFCTTVR